MLVQDECLRFEAFGVRKFDDRVLSAIKYGVYINEELNKAATSEEKQLAERIDKRTESKSSEPFDLIVEEVRIAIQAITISVDRDLQQHGKVLSREIKSAKQALPEMNSFLAANS